MILGSKLIRPVSNPPYHVILVAVPYAATGYVYISKDKGDNWSTYSILGNTNNMMHLAVVKNSILMGRTGASTSLLEYSTDLWVNKYQPSVTARGYPQTVAISADGQVMFNVIGSSGYYNISTNGGSSWSQASLVTNAIGCAISADGSKIYTSNTSNSKLKYTTDTGANWSETGNLYSGYALNGIGMSGDGNYIYVGVRNNGDRFIKSTDGGSNWSSATLVGSRSSGTNGVNMSCSNSGKYVFFHTYAENYVSNDYGVNWTRVLSSYPYTYSYCKVVSYSGRYMAIGDYTNNNQFYFSEDYGVNWSTKSISGITVPIRAVVVNEYY